MDLHHLPNTSDPVFQGDTIETVDLEAVGLVFLDKTTPSISSEGGKRRWMS